MQKADNGQEPIFQKIWSESDADDSTELGKPETEAMLGRVFAEPRKSIRKAGTKCRSPTVLLGSFLIGVIGLHPSVDLHQTNERLGF